MLALPVSAVDAKRWMNQKVADRVSIVLNSWVSTRSYIVGYAKSPLHSRSDSDDDLRFDSAMALCIHRFCLVLRCPC